MAMIVAITNFEFIRLIPLISAIGASVILAVIAGVLYKVT